LPRFDARELVAPSPGRGFGVQLYQFWAGRGRSYFVAVAFAEMIPRPENRVILDERRRDVFGIPILRVDCTHGPAERAQACEQAAALRALAEIAKVALIRLDETPAPPGTALHECGTARMGTDPTNSVIDPNNECWDARGLYVTDGACFPSQGNQNPTLTILALTARACNHALQNLTGRSPYEEGILCDQRALKIAQG
jgi:choline dehydrogenase-like flavoprotein